jgi:hypothetical protein
MASRPDGAPARSGGASEGERGHRLRLGPAAVRPDLHRCANPGRRHAGGEARAPRHRLLYPRPAPGSGGRAAGPVPRPLAHLPAGPRHLSRQPPQAPRLLHSPPGVGAGRRGGQPHLCPAPHGAGAARFLLDQPRQPRARLSRGGRRQDRQRDRHGDGREPRPRLQRPRARVVAVVPGGRCPGRPARHRRGPGAAARRAHEGPRRRLYRPVGGARQRTGHRALREAGLPARAVLRGQAQEPDQRAAVRRPRTGRGAQPLRPHHHRRGAPPRRLRGDHRCRGRLLPPGLWRAQHPLPRGADRPDEFGRHVDLRRQGGDAPDRRAGRDLGAGAAGNRGCRRDRALPGRARRAGGQAGARRAGARRRRGRRDAGSGRGRGGQRQADLRPGAGGGVFARRGPAAHRDRLRAGGGGHPPAGPGRRRRPQHGAPADRPGQPPPRRRHGRRIADTARRRDLALHRRRRQQP